MAILTCPACNHWGPAGRSEEAFDYLQRDGLLELRRCRRCGAYLLVRFTLFPTDTEAEVIPDEVIDAARQSASLAGLPWPRLRDGPDSTARGARDTRADDPNAHR